MTTHYSVTLPVKPYIKKYVAAVEGSPVLFTSRSMLCMIIRAYMENKNHTGLSKKQLQTSINARTATIVVQLPMRSMHYVGTSVRPDSIILINQFLEMWFGKALLDFMKQTANRPGRYKGFNEAYYEFAQAYGIEIEEDISLDALKKMDYRLRHRGGNDFTNLVPSL